MDNEYLIEFYLAEGDSAIGIVAVTVDPGDTATDAVIAVHNGYSKFVKTTDNGGRYYRTRMEGVPLAFHVDQFNHVRVV